MKEHRVKIGPHSWRIRVQRSIRDDGEVCYGLCDHGERLIKVRRMPDRPDIQAAIVIHELIHAWEKRFNFLLRDSGKDYTEAQIDRVGIAILEFARANPGYLDRLAKYYERDK